MRRRISLFRQGISQMRRCISLFRPGISQMRRRRAGQPRALFELRTGNWDAAPDGKRFLVLKEPETVASEAKMQAVVNWFEELRRKAPPVGKP